MRQISARSAVRNMRSIGEFAQWSFREENADAQGYESTRGDMAAGRVFRDFIPKITPKFTLGDDAAIFTSGSCFAREIELALHALGKNVLSWSPEEALLRPEAFNRYNTFSVINDFRLAATSSFNEDLIWKTPVGWIDYSANGVYQSREALIEARQASADAHKRISNADVFILTLGLVETWYDLQAETYLNFTPSEVLAGNLSRFECRVTDYNENVKAVKFLINFLRKNFTKDLKVIITVSPVPLLVSFTGEDIVQANTFSKATLRAVAQNIADEDDNVDYFPSYEIVTMSDPQKAWLPDYRHVNHETISRIMDTFIEHYLK